MAVPHKCTRCETRHTFGLRWDEYRNRKKCRNCGSYKFFVDKAMLKRRNTVKACWCSGYHFPHRNGSKWCEHYSGTLTVHDLRERNLA